MSKISKIAVINATTGVSVYLEDGSQVILNVGDEFASPATKADAPAAEPVIADEAKSPESTQDAQPGEPAVA